MKISYKKRIIKIKSKIYKIYDYQYRELVQYSIIQNKDKSYTVWRRAVTEKDKELPISQLEYAKDDIEEHQISRRDKTRTFITSWHGNRNVIERAYQYCKTLKEAKLEIEQDIVDNKSYFDKIANNFVKRSSK